MGGVMTTVESSFEENDGGGEVIDRLSNLPDSILLHILSFLPTETTVGTVTLVSQRYRYLWKDLQVFHFSCYYKDSKSFKRFSLFVDGVFNLRRSTVIRKMHLDLGIPYKDPFAADSIDRWIRAAMGPCLEELSLRFFGIRSLVLPHTICNCTNLVSLSLIGASDVNMQHSSAPVLFPSLKILILQMNYMDSLDALLFGCPVLQTLKILYSNSKVCVPPFLKRFEFYGVGSCPYLEINAPGLQYLRITNDTNHGETFNFVVGNLQNVVDAYINVFFPMGESEFVNPLLNLLRALCRVKRLKLPRLTIKSLFCAPVLDFPEFRYLLHLHITLPSYNLNFLLNMLEKCPMLQDLIVLREKEPPLGGKWELLSTKLPNCLVSHLTSIHIGLYRGFEDELLEIAEYILLKGLILKTMFILVDSLLDLNEKHYILERLSDIPRGSAMCQIKFSWYLL